MSRQAAERLSGTDKVALFEALEVILVACRENKLVRFAHNWNDGTME